MKSEELTVNSKESCVGKSVLREKSFLFSLRIVKLYKWLCEKQNEYVLSKQVLRSGTAIGALLAEAKYAQTSKDFIHKLSISLKEANETIYWLELLYKSNHISKEMYKSIYNDNTEILKLLISIINTKRSKNEK